ncbi:helix-turn-helix domain-containing protein [Desulforhopalus sp. IMCC35007]|uniref:AlbA family DNA-binding domain-containing protein n=1 Tax=Desulforhopalus sp. IMCC35007 TaxID=2569543 RepID=UPI0010ADC0DB|nr:ATP-binding protein [Desulforhopalus sp. IMCC35007]TKB05657.1 ATP-binding protein [Desulforhopalus sp. IMCC35007]
MKNAKRLIPYIFPLLGFILIILVMNGYQFFKLKRDVNDNLIQEIGEVELRELKMFFSDAEEMLLLIRDWGRNDVLLRNGPVSLHKKLIPLLDRQQLISGLSIASEKGEEYLLYRNDAHFIARHSVLQGQETLQSYTEWDENILITGEWQAKNSYDPRNSRWYAGSGSGDKVQWTGVYPLPETMTPGLTSSISWVTQEDKPLHMVCALHVSLDRIEKILSRGRDKPQSLIFLVRPDESFLLLNRNTTSGSGSTGDAEAVQNLIGKWREMQHPIRKLVRIGNEKQRWIATFYEVGQNDNLSWVGVAARNGELVGWLDKSLFSLDLVELVVAVGGGILILFFMKRSGLLFHRKEKKNAKARLNDYLLRGEGGTVEFKSTVRVNLKTGKLGKEIELAWLKAVVALLNSDGGSLLLGVNDSGEVCGLDMDNFDNTDRCLLHVKNLLNQHIGAEYSPFIDISIVTQEKGDVVMLECLKAASPVFLKIGSNEEFYIRSGPSSVKLSPSQIVNFVQQQKK